MYPLMAIYTNLFTPSFSGLNRYWYEEHFPPVGLKIEEIVPNGNWFEFIAQELSRARFVSRTYSSAAIGWLMLASSYPLRFLLSLLSKWDRGSNELLCFGFMVKAQKWFEVGLYESERTDES